MWAGRERGPWSGQQLSCPTTLKWSSEPSRHRKNNALDLPRICPIFPAEQGSWVMESVPHQKQQAKGDPSPFFTPLEIVSYRHTSLAIYKCICPALYASVYSNFLSKKLIFAVIGPAPLSFPEKKNVKWVSQGGYSAPTYTQKEGISQLKQTAEFNKVRIGTELAALAGHCP